MTSGNAAEEPIARTDDEARARLAGLADAILLHDRAIHARADDSVVRTTSRGPIPMRRARGYVPDAIALPVAGPPVLAVGGHERNTVCLTRGGHAILSPHIGDLDHPETDAYFREAVARLEELVGAAPAAIAHDLHPDYRSTRWALTSSLPRIAVQHHHAHVAACLAEHGRADRVIGVAFDGTGLGDDGTLWGGEILDADLGSARRVGHLRALALPGGEAAIRQPWRAALAAVADAGLTFDAIAPFASTTADERRRVAALLGTPHAPRATGAGRWFDAVAVLLGAARETTYDGQAAAQLEALAQPAAEVARAPLRPLAFELASGSPTADGAPFELDLRPAIRELVTTLRRRAADAPTLAARFHETLAAAIHAGCRHARAHGAPPIVVLTGGCFQNRLLFERTAALLEADAFEVLAHRRVPPNDGGLALGQAAVASYRLARSPCA
jgi:hydrogenase maturation protein HypF